MITTKDVNIKDYGPGKLGKIISTNKTQPKEFRPKGKPKAKSDIRITTANVKQLQAIRKKEMVEEKRAATIRQKKYNEEMKAAKAKENSKKKDVALHDGEPVYQDENKRLFIQPGKERVYLSQKT